MVRLAGPGLLFVCLLAGCAPIKAQLQHGLENIGLDRQEQREMVQTARDVALSPARHGAAGVYVTGGANPEYQAGGGEIGMIYNDYWWDARAGLALYLSGAARNIFVGPTAAVHLQLPTRLSPFAGVGVFAGYSKTEGAAVTDLLPSNEENDADFNGAFASVFPEVGAHFWLTDHLRLTCSASYHITTEGRRSDFWMVGGGIALLLPSSR